MKDNPTEAIPNFIHWYNYFNNDPINCPSIWEFRKEIADAMNMSWWDIQINLNDNSLGPIEFIKFAQYTYKIAHWENSEPNNKKEALKGQFAEYGNIHAEDKSLLGDRFVTDLNSIWINRQLTSNQIAARFFQLANWGWLSEGVEKK
jgi:hypothetical protein